MATIAVDFDGTIVTHEYPKIGTELPFATETLKMLIRDHHKLILWSVREGKLLDEAVEWCRERGVEFWAVNKDYPEESLENNNTSPANSKPTGSLTTEVSAVCLIGGRFIRLSPTIPVIAEY